MQEQRGKESTKQTKPVEDGPSKKYNEGKRQSINSIGNVSCRICFDSAKDEQVITPCLCKGSIGEVHQSCLQKWLAINNKNSCELCKFKFLITRTLKFGICYSIYYFIFKEERMEYRRDVLRDFLSIFLSGPILFTIIYCVLVASNHYPRGNEISAIVCNLMLASVVAFVMYLYDLWISTLLVKNGRNWYKWWQMCVDVKLLSIATPPERPRKLYRETSFV